MPLTIIVRIAIALFIQGLVLTSMAFIDYPAWLPAWLLEGLKFTMAYIVPWIVVLLPDPLVVDEAEGKHAHNR